MLALCTHARLSVIDHLDHLDRLPPSLVVAPPLVVAPSDLSAGHLLPGSTQTLGHSNHTFDVLDVLDVNGTSPDGDGQWQ